MMCAFALVHDSKTSASTAACACTCLNDYDCPICLNRTASFALMRWRRMRSSCAANTSSTTAAFSGLLLATCLLPLPHPRQFPASLHRLTGDRYLTLDSDLWQIYTIWLKSGLEEMTRRLRRCVDGRWSEEQRDNNKTPHCPVCRSEFELG